MQSFIADDSKLLPDTQDVEQKNRIRTCYWTVFTRTRRPEKRVWNDGKGHFCSDERGSGSPWCTREPYDRHTENYAVRAAVLGQMFRNKQETCHYARNLELNALVTLEDTRVVAIL